MLLTKRNYVYWLVMAGFTFLLVACGSSVPETPEEAAVFPPAIVADVITPDRPEQTPPPTWTSIPTQPPPNTATPLPTTTPAPPTFTFTPLPTNTPPPTETPIPVPTDTPTPEPTATTAAIPPTQAPAAPPPAPTVPDNPVLGTNILPNPSFEGGWYHTYGIGELQTPNDWIFEWDEGPTGFGSESWDTWVRPEMRVLSPDYLPSHEHNLFIWDGIYTVKIFKGAGAISYRLFTETDLAPGTYVFKINIFPDVYEDYQAGQKVWASDPYSGEVTLFTNLGSTGWILPAFGQRNELEYAFTVPSAQRVRVGVSVRGRYAVANNGWFLDNWSLKQVEG